MCVCFYKEEQGVKQQTRRGKADDKLVLWPCLLSCTSLRGLQHPGSQPLQPNFLLLRGIVKRILSLLKSHWTCSNTMQTEGWVSHPMNTVLSHQQAWGATQVPHSGLLPPHHHVPPPAPSAPCTPAQVEPGGGFIHTNCLWFFTHLATKVVVKQHWNFHFYTLGACIFLPHTSKH